MTDSKREDYTIPEAERVTVERRPRKRYKAKYITVRGWLLIAMAVIAWEAAVIFFEVMRK